MDAEQPSQRLRGEDILTNNFRTLETRSFILLPETYANCKCFLGKFCRIYKKTASFAKKSDYCRKIVKDCVKKTIFTRAFQNNAFF